MKGSTESYDREVDKYPPTAASIQYTHYPEHDGMSLKMIFSVSCIVVAVSIAFIPDGNKETFGKKCLAWIWNNSRIAQESFEWEKSNKLDG